MFGIFKPAPHTEPITDSVKVRKLYRYWQFRTLFGMYIGYVFFYFTRKNLPIAMAGMMSEFGYTMTDIGWILTVASLAYGVSKFVSGLMSDRSNPRYFMGIGLMVTGLLNILFGMSSAIVLLAIIWGFNGWFQGFGWPPCSRLLTHWYPQKERARWWSVWNTSHNLGGFLIPILATECIVFFGSWRWALYLPGIMSIVVGFFLINRLRDTPQSLGLPSIEAYSGERTEPGGERELSTREILFKYVLSNRYIWLLAIASALVYFVRQSINDWSFIYLTQGKGCSPRAAGLAVGCFEIGGLFGSLSAGWLSDIVFKGKRGPVNALFSVGVIASVIMLWAMPMGGAWVASAATFLTGFFIFGPQMLIGIAAAELSHKKAAATATGFAGLFAYVLGASLAGAPVAHVAQVWGWNGFFVTVLGCGIVMTLFLMPMWGISRREEPPTSSDADESEAKYA
jgi:MFS transporter, OPA family, sugar phosphate sensor protein UhpC